VDSSPLVAFPRADDSSDPAAAGVDALAEIDAAIALVSAQVARRVRLTALPFFESIAGLGLAHARAAGLAFRLEPPERAGVITVTIGPAEVAAVR
jgi:hypothetical protein